MSTKEFVRVPSNGHFLEVVQAYETANKEYDKTYMNSINKMSQTNLGSLNQKDVESILNPFFLRWGKMSRVLGFVGVKQIGKILKEMNDDLSDFRYYSLEKDLERSSKVETIYDRIMNSQFKSDLGEIKRICPTAASKALHLVAPDFFMMWDDPIRKYNGFNDSGEEYQRFLVNMKHWIECINPIVTDLSQKLGKAKTKIIDEYNWYNHRY
jgi:hypothetical protein